MPNIRSAKKRMRQGDKWREQNRRQTATLRTAIKKVRMAATRADAERAYQSAEQLLDRAAGKRLVHPNAAARQKARLTKALRLKS